VTAETCANAGANAGFLLVDGSALCAAAGDDVAVAGASSRDEIASSSFRMHVVARRRANDRRGVTRSRAVQQTDRASAARDAGTGLARSKVLTNALDEMKSIRKIYRKVSCTRGTNLYK
jgi:hypothetical protein